MTRTVFESLAWLFAPAGRPEGRALVEAGRDWRIQLPRTASAVVWGRMPSRHLGLAHAVRSAVARERSLLAARGGRGGLRLWDVWRIPPVGRRPRWQAGLRGALLGGAVVRFGSDPAEPRVADRIAALAGFEAARGHTAAPIELRVSGDGSALASVRGAPTRGRSTPAILRLATLGGLKDASRNADALRRLREAGVTRVPGLLATGSDLGVGWSVERALGGHPVRSLTPGLLRDVVDWASTLSHGDSPATALEERLEVILRTFPEWELEIRPVLDDVRRRSRDVPGVMEHGDLWAGNLLADGDRLTGVVDWDNWHPAGVPGADLLHLWTMARRSRTGQEVGELWRERPWADPEFRARTAAYWQGLGHALTEGLAWLAGVDWWAAHLVAGLRRGRQPAADPRWVARNVANVAPFLSAYR